jgi:hypothetical protein
MGTFFDGRSVYVYVCVVSSLGDPELCARLMAGLRRGDVESVFVRIRPDDWFDRLMRFLVGGLLLSRGCRVVQLQAIVNTSESPERVKGFATAALFSASSTKVQPHAVELPAHLSAAFWREARLGQLVDIIRREVEERSDGDA